MAQATAQPDEIAQEMKRIKMMLVVGGLFAAVGYLLVGSALFFELTQFHPLLTDFFATQTNHSLAGGGPERTSAALNAQLATIHSWPSTLLWLKLGGIAHILTGIFVVLAAIVRALSMMPIRLGSLMQETMGATEGSASEGPIPADD